MRRSCLAARRFGSGARSQASAFGLSCFVRGGCAARRRPGAARRCPRAGDGAQALPTRANCHGDDSLSAGDGAAENLLASFKVVLAALAESHRSTAPRRAYVRDRSVLQRRQPALIIFVPLLHATAGATRDARNRQAKRADRSFRGAAPAVPRQRAASDKFRSSSRALDAKRRRRGRADAARASGSIITKRRASREPSWAAPTHGWCSSP